MLDELEALYRAKLPEFRRVAAAIARDRELGRDAVQEAFASAVRQRRGYRGSGSPRGRGWRVGGHAARGRPPPPAGALPPPPRDLADRHPPGPPPRPPPR